MVEVVMGKGAPKTIVRIIHRLRLYSRRRFLKNLVLTISCVDDISCAADIDAAMEVISFPAVVLPETSSFPFSCSPRKRETIASSTKAYEQLMSPIRAEIGSANLSK
jgi:hypothetical protein